MFAGTGYHMIVIETKIHCIDGARTHRQVGRVAPALVDPNIRALQVETHSERISSRAP